MLQPALLATILVVTTLGLSVSFVTAQVNADDVITPARADKVKDLVSPGIYQGVKNGLTMKEHLNYPITCSTRPPPRLSQPRFHEAQLPIVEDAAGLRELADPPLLTMPIICEDDPDASPMITAARSRCVPRSARAHPGRSSSLTSRAWSDNYLSSD